MSSLNGNKSRHQVINDNCLNALAALTTDVDLTFLDPPFNQQKDYASWEDDLPEHDYWAMMREICSLVYQRTTRGGAIYFMQREKNTEQVLGALRQTGWEFQNLVIWKKMTSAVPCSIRFGKAYQVIGYATKGKRPRVFHRLRINPPLLKHQRHERVTGCFVTDIWDDIRELTSGYFAGDEALRKNGGDRFHKQQSPIALLLRILLASSRVGDTVLDPFAGTGTTSIVAKQLQRNSVSIELDRENALCIANRLARVRPADSVGKYFIDYAFTENLAEIWGEDLSTELKGRRKANASERS